MLTIAAILASLATAQSAAPTPTIQTGAVAIGMYWRGGFTEREWDEAAIVDRQAVRLVERTGIASANQLPVRTPDEHTPISAQHITVDIDGWEERFCLPRRNQACILKNIPAGTYTITVRHHFFGRVTLRGVRIIGGETLELAVARPTYQPSEFVEALQPEVSRAYIRNWPSRGVVRLPSTAPGWSANQALAVEQRLGCEPEVTVVGLPGPSGHVCLH